MIAKLTFAASFVAMILFGATALATETDFPGSSDHPDLPRVEGTRIGGYSFAEYDAGLFVVGVVEQKWRPRTISPEGKRTRIIYSGRTTQSSLQIYRNYQKAFAQLGELKEVYTCQGKACEDGHIGDAAVWEGDNRIPTDLVKHQNYANGGTNKNQMYFYGTVVKDDIQFHVSVFTAFITNPGSEKANNRPIAHVEILEVEDFTPELVSLDAAEMSNQLETKGHVAIYGILFDTNSADLKSESTPVIAEIAKALAADSEINAYVVGHTDNVGDLEYNQTLSLQRASSVVAALSGDYGVSLSRLTPIGVGPVAPEANNGDDDGRALNRRVEIVKR